MVCFWTPPTDGQSHSRPIAREIGCAGMREQCPRSREAAADHAMATPGPLIVPDLIRRITDWGVSGYLRAMDRLGVEFAWSGEVALAYQVVSEGPGGFAVPPRLVLESRRSVGIARTLRGSCASW